MDTKIKSQRYFEQVESAKLVSSQNHGNTQFLDPTSNLDLKGVVTASQDLIVIN